MHIICYQVNKNIWQILILKVDNFVLFQILCENRDSGNVYNNYFTLSYGLRIIHKILGVWSINLLGEFQFLYDMIIVILNEFFFIHYFLRQIDKKSVQYEMN